jgi:N-acetylglutamate synthase
MINYNIQLLTIDNYEEVFNLWKCHDGIGLSNSDSKENIFKYLNRNPNNSFIALLDNIIIGNVLGGHDARRGYIYHLIVDPNYRFNGIGKSLVFKCLDKFKEIGIDKSHVFVFNNNEKGIIFWNKIGFNFRNDLSIMSFNIK